VDERGGLERVTGSFASHFSRSQMAKFIVNNGEQFSGAPGVALLDGVQNERDVTHYQ
jgi:hypothetical protein